MSDRPVGSGQQHGAGGRMSDLERYVLMRCAGSFKVGQQGQLLVYPFTWRGGYVVGSAQTYRRLQLVNAMFLPTGMVVSGLIGLALLALGVKLSAVQFVVTTGVLLSGVIVLGVALWIRARFERSSEALTSDEVRRARASIQSHVVVRTLLIGTIGFGVLGASVVAVQFAAFGTAALLLCAAGLTLAYFAHRFLRRSGLPPAA